MRESYLHSVSPDLPPDPPPSPPSPSAVTEESLQPTQLSPPRRLTVQFPVNFIHSELDTHERRGEPLLLRTKHIDSLL